MESANQAQEDPGRHTSTMELLDKEIAKGKKRKNQKIKPEMKREDNKLDVFKPPSNDIDPDLAGIDEDGDKQGAEKQLNPIGQGIFEQGNTQQNRRD